MSTDTLSSAASSSSSSRLRYLWEIWRSFSPGWILERNQTLSLNGVAHPDLCPAPGFAEIVFMLLLPGSLSLVLRTDIKISRPLCLFFFRGHSDTRANSTLSIFFFFVCLIFSDRLCTQVAALKTMAIEGGPTYRLAQQPWAQPGKICLWKRCRRRSVIHQNFSTEG